MIFIREEHNNDILEIEKVHQLAFKADGEANLVNSLRKTNFYIPTLSLVATQEGSIVGHVLFTRIVIKDGNHTFPAIALAPLGVTPEHQRKGIGTQLVKAGVEKCKYMGHKLVVVLGDPKYYSRFGFELASNYEITPPVGFPEEAFMLCKLTDEDLNITGTVQYPSQFFNL
ncbi:MAG: GNAT family N-acetyltransferase [Cellulosilyticaceae bacterium]